MLYTLKVDPNTRINDCFVKDNRIDCTYPNGTFIWSDLIPRISGANTTRYRADFYNKIALDIVTEAVFDYPYPYITEKTLRPIACKRMFVLVGPAYTLRCLREYGFVTWSDMIDESYDTITDPQLRFLAIIDAIGAFCQIPLDTIRCQLVANQDRLEHNFQVLQSLRETEIAKLKQKLKDY